MTPTDTLTLWFANTEIIGDHEELDFERLIERFESAISNGSYYLAAQCAPAIQRHPLATTQARAWIIKALTQ